MIHRELAELLEAFINLLPLMLCLLAVAGITAWGGITSRRRYYHPPARCTCNTQTCPNCGKPLT